MEVRDPAVLSRRKYERLRGLGQTEARRHTTEGNVVPMATDEQDSNGATRVAYIPDLPLAEHVVRQWPQMGEVVRTRQLIAEVEGNFPELTLEIGRRLQLGDVVVAGRSRGGNELTLAFGEFAQVLTLPGFPDLRRRHGSDRRPSRDRLRVRLGDYIGIANQQRCTGDGTHGFVAVAPGFLDR